MKPSRSSSKLREVDGREKERQRLGARSDPGLELVALVGQKQLPRVRAVDRVEEPGVLHVCGLPPCLEDLQRALEVLVEGADPVVDMLRAELLEVAD